MTTPPRDTRSRWASLWGGAGADREKTAQELRAELEQREAVAAQEHRKVDGRRDALGRPSALDVRDDEEDADGRPIRPVEFTLRATGYGGVTVTRADSPTSAFLGILALCEKHLPAWDATLTRYGVLVAQLEQTPPIAFYIRRSSDGMTLAVPDARTRSEALIQIVQALLELQVKHRAAMQAGGVTPFRNG